jgi:hypothetical protein
MDRMNGSEFATTEIKVYRLNRANRLYHFAVGTAALVGAVKVHSFFILALLAAMFAVFMIARPLVMAVTVDQFSVTFKGMFSENSLQRSSITAVEIIHTGKGDILRLWGNIDEKEKLDIPALFSFDDAWDNWWSPYGDLSDDKPLSLF